VICRKASGMPQLFRGTCGNPREVEWLSGRRRQITSGTFDNPMGWDVSD
jgi:hypothetical protein